MDIVKQVAALPVRTSQEGAVEVLLVTSRETRRWVLPKGWPSKRLKDKDAAAREAKQEAGATGKIASKPIGTYRYRKVEGATWRLVEVSVYVLKVKNELKRWREQEQRERQWFPASVAARRVREPKLRLLLKSLTGEPATTLRARRLPAAK
ncbi:MAG: NUDIX hydrolase [Hyphomicrobium sp.]